MNDQKNDNTDPTPTKKHPKQLWADNVPTE